MHLAPSQPLVLGLPRGGVVVAAAVAAVLGTRHDVVLVRKVGVPGHPELAMGAIGESGVRVMNPEVITSTGVTPEEFDSIAETEQRELERRVELYRGGRPMPTVEGETVIVVDDGIATGATARAALEVVRAGAPAHLVLATPVAAPDTLATLEALADEVVAVDTPARMHAVGAAYRHFDQTSDEEVVRLLSS